MEVSAPFRTVLLLFICLPLFMGTCKEEEAQKRNGNGKTDQEARIGDGEWKLRSMRKGAEKHSFEHPYTLRIKNDTAIELQLKVNECFASYRIPEPGAVRIGSLSCTEMCCDPDLAKELSRNLSKIEHYELKNEKLILLGEELRIEGIPGEEAER